MKELKFLYETTIKKHVDEPQEEVREESNGEKVVVKRTIKKVKSIKVAIIKPNRKLFEGAEIFYSKHIADFIRLGLLPYSLVAKRYANDGGPLSEAEKEKLDKLKAQAKELEAEFFATPDGEESTQKRNEILIKINDINNEISSIQNNYVDIFENTAEMKARNRTIEWWTLFLSFIDEDGTGYKPLFGEGEYDKKLEKYDEITELDNPFYNECIRKLSYLISFWLAARASVSNIDFGSMDKLYEEKVTDYKIEEEKEIKVEEVK